jgi:hypothetical protein
VVALAQEIDRGVALAQEIGPVAEPARAPSRPRDRLVVARTALATAVSRAVLLSAPAVTAVAAVAAVAAAVVLAVVALVAAAELPLDPPAAEVDIAWEAAAFPVVADPAVAAADAAAAAGAEGKTITNEGKTNENRNKSYDFVENLPERCCDRYFRFPRPCLAGRA